MVVAGKILSYIAMAIAILSYQAKKQKTFTAIQIVSTTIFAISFMLLGATTGALLNFIAATRALVYFNKQKLHSDRPIWFFGYGLAYIAAFAMTFFVFGAPQNAFNIIKELLPVIGMLASHLAIYINDDKAVRRFSLVSSPVWLVYNVFSNSPGGVICEAFSIVSIIIGMFRHDIKGNKKDAN